MTRAVVVAAAATAAVAVALTFANQPGAETAGDLGAAVGLGGEPAYAIRLAGPLWDDRMIQDGEGTPDIAVIARDETLAAAIHGPPVAMVELRLDGRTQQRVRPSCPGGRCPRSLFVRFRPRLDARRGGDRRVDVVVRGAAGSATSVASLRVRVVPRLPAVLEAKPASRRSAAGALPAARRRAALRVLAAARRGGGLHALLGAAGLRVRAAGALRDGPRSIGATLWLSLTQRRYNVAAAVPGYRPGSPYVPRLVSLRVAALSDVLVDVDLRTRRVISVEPGPASVTTSWSPSDPAPPPVTATTAASPPRMVRASETGPAFLGYDGNPGLGSGQRDWPVSLVFAGRATVGKVKDALRRVGLTRRGLTQYLAYRRPGGGVRFDGDRGLKTACDQAGTDVHLRLYAPAEVDHFTDPKLGSFVVATTHLDQHDNCGNGPPRFGFSAAAEQRIGLLARRLGWRVQRDALALGNAEPYRRDVRDPAHIWFGDGRATLIWVP